MTNQRECKNPLLLKRHSDLRNYQVVSRDDSTNISQSNPLAQALAKESQFIVILLDDPGVVFAGLEPDRSKDLVDRSFGPIGLIFDEADEFVGNGRDSL